MEGLAGVLEADLPNYKSKILRILCTVYVCRRTGGTEGCSLSLCWVCKLKCLRQPEHLWWLLVLGCCYHIKLASLQAEEIGGMNSLSSECNLRKIFPCSTLT